MLKDIELLNDLGYIKCTLAKKDPVRFFIRAWIAGAYLGAAAILSYTLGALFQDNPALARVLVAGTFGIGLAAIVFLGGELFTGNCFTTMIPVYDGRLKITDLLPAWILCYIGNCIGVGTICFLFIKSGAMNASLSTYLAPSLTSKLTFDVTELFIKGIQCNFIVCIGAYCGIKLKDDTVKLLMILLFVMAFVLPGFEHCIANAGTFTMGITLLGNQINWTLLPLHMLISTIGNILGGSILLGLPVYIIFREH